MVLAGRKRSEFTMLMYQAASASDLGGGISVGLDWRLWFDDPAMSPASTFPWHFMPCALLLSE